MVFIKQQEHLISMMVLLLDKQIQYLEQLLKKRLYKKKFVKKMLI